MMKEPNRWPTELRMALAEVLRKEGVEQAILRGGERPGPTDQLMGNGASTTTGPPNGTSSRPIEPGYRNG